jgi:hypothetical protein
VIHFFFVGIVIAKTGPFSHYVLTLDKDSERLLQKIDVRYWKSTELIAYFNTVYFISGSVFLHLNTGYKARKLYIVMAIKMQDFNTDDSC